MKFIGIIGYPLKHSISPAFQQAALDHYEMEVRYEKWPTTPELLGARMEKLRDDEYLGANVTIPYKETVLEFLDSVDVWATRIGAVNTVAKRGGKLVGYNTDSEGFIRSLKEHVGLDLSGLSVLILGAGGAARAAVFGLAKENIASITIVNRSIDRAQLLAEEIGGFLSQVSVFGLDRNELSKGVIGVDIIINATSLGMRYGAEEGTNPLGPGLIPSNVLVYDMVYTPSRTPLMLEASKVGAHAVGGLSMLVYQGAGAFEKWFAKSAPMKVMFRAAEEALGEQDV